VADGIVNFDMDALCQGKMPWTIFAYPCSLADAQQLPRDDEAKRFLAELQSLGLRVGVWAHPNIKDTIFFACPYEDRLVVHSAIEELERQGRFPPNFPARRTDHLFSLAARNT
jgi:hypothetical protein